MADITIHHVEKIEIDKYQLDSGTWVCKIDILSKIELTGQESKESITLFSTNNKIFKSLRET